MLLTSLEHQILKRWPLGIIDAPKTRFWTDSEILTGSFRAETKRSGAVFDGVASGIRTRDPQIHNLMDLGVLRICALPNWAGTSDFRKGA